MLCLNLWSSSQLLPIYNSHNLFRVFKRCICSISHSQCNLWTALQRSTYMKSMGISHWVSGPPHMPRRSDRCKHRCWLMSCNRTADDAPSSCNPGCHLPGHPHFLAMYQGVSPWIPLIYWKTTTNLPVIMIFHIWHPWTDIWLPDVFQYSIRHSVSEILRNGLEFCLILCTHTHTS